MSATIGRKGAGRCLANVGLKQMRVSCIIGINPSERVKEQVLLLDCMCKYDIGQCVRDENIDHAVSYSALSKRVREFIQERQFLLLETLAYETICMIHGEWNQVEHVSLVITKPAAVPKALATVELDSINAGLAPYDQEAKRE